MMTKAEVGWIDFSPKDRHRVGTILDMLKPEGIVDELGVGRIRDSLADQLFPGISTIQTRAKYFFIVPYILYEYQKKTPAQRQEQSAAKFLENQEYEVMWQLAETYGYREGSGVIGITKRRYQKIMRRPSAIYWNGMIVYRFINSSGMSLDAFLRQRSLAAVANEFKPNKILINPRVNHLGFNSPKLASYFSGSFSVLIPRQLAARQFILLQSIPFLSFLSLSVTLF